MTDKLDALLERLECWRLPLLDKAAAAIRELRRRDEWMTVYANGLDKDVCREMERCNKAEAERDALRAENEALRADAERYRWLRGSPVCWWSESVAARMYQGDALDAAIDEARSGDSNG